MLPLVRGVIETSIPASSAIVAKLINVMYDQKSNAKVVADTIEHDPSLAVNVLKKANSAYYGCSSKIDSLQRAVVLLGLDTLKEIVSTLGSVGCFKKGKDSDSDVLTGLWYHSIGTAKACRFISNKLYVERPDIAYVAGLLHDIGKILLSIYFPEQFQNVLDLTKEKHTRFILAERRLLHTDHTAIGSLLCEIWSLPEDISTAIMTHHDPTSDKKGGPRLALIVELGDYMCRKAGIGFPGDEITNPPSAGTKSLLGKKQEDVKENYNAIFEELIASKPEIDNYFKELES